ncbi:MAG: DUF2125 domain-containing protein [Rhizomicrobium sp.]
MRYSHRFFLYAPVAALLLLGLAASLYWLTAYQRFTTALARLNGHEVLPGVRLSYTAAETGGFPFRLDAVLKDVRLQVQTSHGPVSWTSQHFALHSLDYGDMHILLEAAGLQRLSWYDPRGIRHQLGFTPGLLRASVLGDHGVVRRIDIELYDARTHLFRVLHAEFHLRKNPRRNALDLVVMADRLRLDTKNGATPADHITKLRLAGRVTPASSWHGLLAGQASWSQAAAAFQAASGHLDIAHLSLAWRSAEAKGNGVLSLDGAARPQGILRLSIDGEPVANGSSKGLLSALLAAASRDHSGVRIAFKDGVSYLNASPVGLVAPLF